MAEAPEAALTSDRYVVSGTLVGRGEGPPVGREGPPVGGEGPLVGGEGPLVGKEGPSVGGRVHPLVATNGQ